MKQEDAFESFHEALKLAPDEIAHAHSFPGEVRDALAAGNVGVAYSFLQGSLARGTMVSPFKDIDMVVTLRRDKHGHLRDDPKGPDVAMDLVQGALTDHLAKAYPKISFPARSRHALNVELGDDLPSFDLVPAFEVDEEDPDDVEIANRDDGTWDWSNPRELRRVVADRNQGAGGRLIHIVRMVKVAARNRLHSDFPGLVVESIACEAIRYSVSYAEGCALVLAEAGEMLDGPIYEPTGHNDLAPKIEVVEPGLTQRAKAWFADASKKAARALDLAADGDHRGALNLWCGIFGDPFPCPKDARSLSSAARDLSFGVGAARPTRSWRSD